MNNFAYDFLESNFPRTSLTVNNARTRLLTLSYGLYVHTFSLYSVSYIFVGWKFCCKQVVRWMMTCFVLVHVLRHENCQFVHTHTTPHPTPGSIANFHLIDVRVFFSDQPCRVGSQMYRIYGISLIQQTNFVSEL